MPSRGKAVQVDIRLTDPGLKALGFQPLESVSLSKLWFQMGQPAPLHRGRGAGHCQAVSQGAALPALQPHHPQVGHGGFYTIHSRLRAY